MELEKLFAPPLHFNTAEYVFPLHLPSIFYFLQKCTLFETNERKFIPKLDDKPKKSLTENHQNIKSNKLLLIIENGNENEYSNFLITSSALAAQWNQGQSSHIAQRRSAPMSLILVQDIEIQQLRVQGSSGYPMPLNFFGML